MSNFDFYNPPTKELWDSRRSWIDTRIQESDVGLSNLTSDHSTALFMDMQIAYCAGAWISVIIMSISVIDSQLREAETVEDSVGTAKLLRQSFVGEDIDWLRSVRNQYVHYHPGAPVFNMNDWFDMQSQYANDAKKAMEMTINALFQYPGT